MLHCLRTQMHCVSISFTIILFCLSRLPVVPLNRPTIIILFFLSNTHTHIFCANSFLVKVFKLRVRHFTYNRKCRCRSRENLWKRKDCIYSYCSMYCSVASKFCFLVMGKTQHIHLLSDNKPFVVVAITLCL
jgi:hypothetical protein